jgi:hypothetical protein
MGKIGNFRFFPAGNSRLETLEHIFSFISLFCYFIFQSRDIEDKFDSMMYSLRRFDDLTLWDIHTWDQDRSDKVLKVLEKYGKEIKTASVIWEANKFFGDILSTIPNIHTLDLEVSISFYNPDNTNNQRKRSTKLVKVRKLKKLALYDPNTFAVKQLTATVDKDSLEELELSVSLIDNLSRQFYKVLKTFIESQRKIRKLVTGKKWKRFDLFHLLALEEFSGEIKRSQHEQLVAFFDSQKHLEKVSLSLESDDQFFEVIASLKTVRKLTL